MELSECEPLSDTGFQRRSALENRRTITRLIREWEADVVLSHRPNDYHPDHRYTSQLVCDAAYMVTVPPIVPEMPALNYNPVIAFLSDNFQRPYPFSPTIVVDIEPVPALPAGSWIPAALTVSR